MDFDEIFSFVATLSSIRTAISYSIQNGFTVYQLHIIMAYINDDSTKEIYMELPESFKNESIAHKVSLFKNLFIL